MDKAARCCVSARLVPLLPRRQDYPSVLLLPERYPLAAAVLTIHLVAGPCDASGGDAVVADADDVDSHHLPSYLHWSPLALLWPPIQIAIVGHSPVTWPASGLNLTTRSSSS